MPLCLSFLSTGNPAEVLQLAEPVLPPLDPQDVRVRLRYSPINPADLNFIEGTYGRAAHPPAVPGHEAFGYVEEIGPEVQNLRVGDPVIPLLGAGCWTQHLTAPEQFFAKVPETIDPLQACMLRVNPVTAWHILKHFTTLVEGDWVAQNAANSGVGRALIQIARHEGLRTVNFVRRPELIPELQALGADAVFLDNPEGVAQAKELLRGEPVRLAGNAVGGDSAIHLMDLLTNEGTLLTYGAMSRRSLKVPNKYLIFKSLNLRGVWITGWFDKATDSELFAVLDPLAKMMAHGELKMRVDEVVPMRDYRHAIQRAQQGGRAGKVILDLA